MRPGVSAGNAPRSWPGGVEPTPPSDSTLRPGPGRLGRRDRGAPAARVLGFAYPSAGEVAQARIPRSSCVDESRGRRRPESVALGIARIGQADMLATDPSVGILNGARYRARTLLSLGYYKSPRVALARLLMRIGQVEQEARDPGGRLPPRRTAWGRRHQCTSARQPQHLRLVGEVDGQSRFDRAAEAHERMEQTHELHRPRGDGIA